MKNIKIIEALVVKQKHGPDVITLTTTLTDPIEKNEKLKLEFKAPKSKGQEYVKNVLGINPETLDFS